MGCKVCASICPREIVAAASETVEIENRHGCIECGAYQQNCPTGAVTVKTAVGRAAAVIHQLLRRKNACRVIEERPQKKPSFGSSCCLAQTHRVRNKNVRSFITIAQEVSQYEKGRRLLIPCEQIPARAIGWNDRFIQTRSR